MKPYAESFYNSHAWKECRRAYSKSVGGLCERCLQRGIYSPGEIVHHKVHITPDNIHDPAITLDFRNLMLLCRQCHAEVHAAREKPRYKVNQDGRVVLI